MAPKQDFLYNHELASSMFVTMLRQKAVSAGLSIYSPDDYGSARLGVPGGRPKAADRVLRPATRVLKID